jgi:enoyl-CoA hydratase/carnithine racemase
MNNQAPQTSAAAPVLTALKDGVLTITLNRPDARNALSEALMHALQLTLDAAAEDKAVRTIILAGAGPAFCSGHDLKEMTSHRSEPDKGLAYFRALFAQCTRLMETIVRHPKPVIARVHAMATASGCQLVAACDLAVAANTARFATPGVNIGLFCSTPMVVLSRNVSRKHAMEMLLTGDIIDAQQAKDWGLVNRVVPPEELDAATWALAAQIAAKPIGTIKTGKVAFYHQLDLSLSAAHNYVCEVMTQNMLDAEAVEGIGAFIEKRAPKWPE